MSTHYHENARSDHKDMQCPRCGDWTGNLPRHIHSAECNP